MVEVQSYCNQASQKTCYYEILYITFISSKTVPLLEEAEDFTILLKNQISFQKFNVQR